MASTRAATGNSKPRVFQAISTEPGRKTTGGKKRGPKKSVATKVKSAGVTKKKAPTKRKTSVKDKVEGAAKKVEGKVLNKPGKEGAGTKQMKGTDGKRGRKAKV
jgi:hypothetical protein